MRDYFSLIIAPFIATIVGFASSVAVVLAAMDAIGASQSQAASGLAMMCATIAISTLILSRYSRLPLVTAWTLPGSAVMAAIEGVTYPHALAACAVVGGLLMLTAAIPALNRWIARLPVPIAAAMLAGILFRFVVQVFPTLGEQPVLCLVVVVVFFIVRQFLAILAVLIAMIVGAGLAVGLDVVAVVPPLSLTRITWVTPEWHWQTAISIGLPVYLVTMVSQNLTGFAVLRASGYSTFPSRIIVGFTGFLSSVIAPFGGLPINLAAVTAAICTSADCHPDQDQRWRCGYWYALFYMLLALAAGGFVILFASFPPALIATIAGLALLSPFISALKQSLQDADQLWASMVTFVVTSSGAAYFGLGAPFWGLMAGIALLALSRVCLGHAKPTVTKQK